MDSAAPAEAVVNVLEGIGDAIYALDREWRVSYANLRACELWGVSREEALGRSAGELFPSWVGSDSHKAHMEASETRRPVGIRTFSRIYRRPIELSVFPSPAGLFVHVRDLTEERRAEAERQTILNTMAQGVAAFDRDGAALYRNPAALAILGIGDELAIRTYVGAEHVLRPRHMDGSPLLREDHPVAHALRGEEVRGLDLRLTRLSDGREIVCRYDAAPLRDAAGAISGAILTFQDITEQVEAAAALQQREEMLRLAQEAAQIGSFSWDVPSGRVVVSPTFAAIYGKPDAPVERPRDDWIDQVHPGDKALMDRLRIEAFARRQPEFHGQFRIVRPDGSLRWVESRSRASYDAAGQPLRVVGVQVDVTARKEGEERQGLLMAELDHRVKNVLAVVQAIAQQTLRSDRQGVADFVGRLAALARAHGLIATRNWQGASLRALLEDTLAPYGGAGGRTTIQGADLLLSPRAAQTLTLAFHEMATNAAKYGALSGRDGSLAVRWRIDPDDPSRLAFEWLESGGPAVRTRPRRGLGARFVAQSVQHELGGSIDLQFQPAGLCARFQLPLDAILGRRREPVDEPGG